MVSKDTTIRLLTEALLRAYYASMANEGVITFGNPTKLIAEVLAGNPADSHWLTARATKRDDGSFVREFVEPSPLDFAVAREVVKSLRVADSIFHEFSIR